MIKMLEMINSIPDSIGWTIVGFMACLCVIMFVKVGKTLVQMYHDHTETIQEEECAD
jgi:hypothetical protein